MAAEYIYPPRGNFSTANNDQAISTADTLIISYRTSWSAVNITLFCRTSATSSQFYYYNAPANPLVPVGSYRFGTIQAVGLGSAVQFPTLCSFKLTKYDDNDSALGGEQFSVRADATTTTTFSMTSSATSTSTSTASISSSSSSSAASRLSATTSATSGTSTAVAATGSANDANDGALSTGAKAGIGVGVSVAVLVVLALLGAMLCSRRRKRGANNGGTQYHEKSAEHSDWLSHRSHPPMKHNELDANGVSELTGSPRPHELAS